MVLHFQRHTPRAQGSHRENNYLSSHKLDGIAAFVTFVVLHSSLSSLFYCFWTGLEPIHSVAIKILLFVHILFPFSVNQKTKPQALKAFLGVLRNNEDPGAHGSLLDSRMGRAS